MSIPLLKLQKGGTLIYISNQIDYKPRSGLNIYVSKAIESTFIELIYPKSKNKIIGCIYNTTSQHTRK